jgi:acyl-CoA thioester hydrolase
MGEFMIKNLDNFPVIVDLPVYWGEMDAFGHVNNTIYFKYFESARIAYLEKMDYKKMALDSRMGIILASINAKFISPLFYPDSIKVGATVTEIKNDRFVMDYALYSANQNKIAAIGSSVVVTYDYKNHAKIDIPDYVVSCIEAIQKNKGDLDLTT